MLLVNKSSMTALRDRGFAGRDDAACLGELKKAIEIKSSLQWRAETAVHCVGNTLPDHLAWEVRMLELALGDLEDGKTDEAAARLDELIAIMDN